jgi:hypothetical protein
MTTGWDEASTIAVACSALATAGMAIYTARLAIKTTSLSASAEKEATAVVAQGKAITKQAEAVAAQASAAAAQLELARESYRATTLPWITVGGPGGRSRLGDLFTGGQIPPLALVISAETLRVDLSIRNVGAGLSIVDPVASHFVGWPSERSNDVDPMNYSRGTIDNPVLLPGEQARLFFEVNYSRWMIDARTLTGQHRNDGQFFIDVVYSDISQQLRVRVRFHVARDRSNERWTVYQADYFEPPDIEDPSVSVSY